MCEGETWFCIENAPDMEEEAMNPVVHFEMPYDNRERMAKFYGAAFGWQTQMLGEEMGHYVVLPRPRKPTRMAPKPPARLTAGFSRKDPIGPDNIRPS
jgi:hypothetical protein